MLIVCPSCATSYNVELASLEPEGRRVRCVRCRTVWRAAPTRSDKLLAAAAAIAPEPDEGADAAFAATAAPWPAEGEMLNHPLPAADAAAAEAAAEASEAAAAGNDTAAADPAPAVAVDAPPIAPVDLDDGRQPVADGDTPAAGPADADATHDDIESYAARQERRNAKRRRWRWPLSRLQNVIVALLIADSVLIGWRDEFVRLLPQTASFYSTLGLAVNLRGLSFDDVATTMEQHEGVPILVVQGSIVNGTGKVVNVPRLKFVVRNAADEEIYSWTAVAPRTTLPPGEAVAFLSRLASPPPEGRDVLVRFITRGDIVGGSR